MSSVDEAKKIAEVKLDNEFMNGDLSKKAIVRTAKIDWSSRRGDIVGKPCYVAGGKLNGAVTVLVKYFPNADFEHHDHPQGEEIFVLDGVFTDERGDHTKGCYMLNPETFEHTPETDERGNLVLIRLRQYPNFRKVRTETVFDTLKMEYLIPTWKKRGEGVTEKFFYDSSLPDQEEYSERQWIERWDKTAIPEPYIVEDLLEMFILEGGYTDSEGTYEKGDWIRLPKGAFFGGRVSDDHEECEFLLKIGHSDIVVPEGVVKPEKIPENRV